MSKNTQPADKGNRIHFKGAPFPLVSSSPVGMDFIIICEDILMA